MTKNDKNKKQVKEVLASIAFGAKLERDYPKGEDKYKTLEEITKLIDIKCFSEVIIVDCRGDELNIPKSHKGFSLFSSERAEYVLGFGDRDKFSTIVSCTGTGKMQGKTLLNNVKDAVKTFKEYDKRFNKESKGVPSLNGGGVTYRPAFIAICNYGYSIHGFSNQYLINSY